MNNKGKIRGWIADIVGVILLFAICVMVTFFTLLFNVPY